MANDKTKTTIPTLAAVRVACAWRGLTIETWARAAGVSTAYVWRILGGKLLPSAEILGKLRAALGEQAWAYAIGTSDRLPQEGIAAPQAARGAA